MTDGPQGSDLDHFNAVIAARKAAKAKKVAEAQYAEKYADLIPGEQYNITEEQRQLDSALSGITIVDAYRRWCHKSTVDVRSGQKESIKCSCPNPAHPDKHPSAWLNLDKNVFYCASCELGGDIYDIAAWNFGYSVPGYKQGRSFHDLRESMARDLGYVIEKQPGSEPLVYKPEIITVLPANEDSVESEHQESSTGSESNSNEPDTEADSEDSQEHVAEVIPIFGELPEEDRPPAIDWRSMLTNDTFLRVYLESTSIDDAAEEYHFWNALLALGAAVGPQVTLFDSHPVYANLLVCILGSTGDRKSRSFAYIRELMRTYLPHNRSDPNSKGVFMPGAIASGEALIGAFSRPIADPTNAKLIVSHGSVRGIVEFNELSSLVNRASRVGSTIKDVVMEFADASKSISTTSITTGTKQADDAFCSMFTTTQPESIKDLLKKSDTTSGFLNRWIFATGTSKPKVAIGGVKPDLTDAGTLLQQIHGWPGLYNVEIQWSDKAHRKFTEHFHDNIEPVQKDNPILARIDLLEKKLILLFCINEMLVEVPERIVDTVIGLHDYLIKIFLSSAQLVSNLENNEIEEELLRQIKMLCDKSPTNTVTLSRVKKNIVHKGWDIKQIQSVWRILKENGDIEEVKLNDTKRGRPTIAYKYIGDSA